MTKWGLPILFMSVYILDVRGFHLEDRVLLTTNNLTDTTPYTLNLVYTSLSLLSFVLSVPALIFTCLYQHRNNAYATATVKHTEELFVLASVVLTLATFVESFQWVYYLYGSDVECELVGALHQYGTAMVLVFAVCVGVHLFIVSVQPKCLMVIDELKRKRYRRVALGFALTTFLVPLLSIPWPPIVAIVSSDNDANYGPYDYKCWLSTYRKYTSTSERSNKTVAAVEEALMIHFWGLFVSLFGTISVSYAYIVLYCRSSRLTYHVCAVTCGMISVPIVTALNVASYVIVVVRGHVQEVEILLYVTAISTPLLFFLAGVAFILRLCLIRYVIAIRRRQYTPIAYPPDKDIRNITAKVLPQCADSSTGDLD